MKNKTNFKKVLMLMAVGTLSILNANAQTALSGTGSNGCTADAGGQATNTAIGCNAGKAGMGANNTVIGNFIRYFNYNRYF